MNDSPRARCRLDLLQDGHVDMLNLHGDDIDFARELFDLFGIGKRAVDVGERGRTGCDDLFRWC